MWITHLIPSQRLFCPLQIRLVSNSSSRTHICGNTLDLVLTRGEDISDLIVSPYTSALSDHFLLTYHMVLSFPCTDHQATYSICHITPATTTAMADKLPHPLAPLCNYRGSVDWPPGDFNRDLSAAIDSVAPLVIKKRSRKKNSSLV